VISEIFNDTYSIARSLRNRWASYLSYFLSECLHYWHLTMLRERKPPPRRPTSTESDLRFKSGLIRIRIWISLGSLSKCCGFISLSASVISPSVVNPGSWDCEKRSGIAIPSFHTGVWYGKNRTVWLPDS